MDLKINFNLEEILEKIINYSPGKNFYLEDITLRKYSEKIIQTYDSLPRGIKKKFPKDEIFSKYDFIREHIPIDDFEN